MEWSTEIPTKPGFYWFIGIPWNGKTNDEKKLHLVSVKQGSNILIFICTGHFMENKKGLWQEAILPDVPEGTKISYI